MDEQSMSSDKSESQAFYVESNDSKHSFGLLSSKKFQVSSFLLLLLSVFFLGSWLVGGFSFMEESETDNTTNMAGVVTFLEGEGSIGKIVASLGDTVRVGDMVRTFEGSKMVIVFDDGSAIRLNEGSSTYIQELQQNQFVLSHEAGEIYYRVDKNENRAFYVVVDGTEVKALGTAFNIDKEEADVEVDVIEEKVSVKDEGIEEEINAGEKLIVKKEEGGKKVEKKELTSEELKNEWYTYNKEQDKAEYSEHLGVFGEDPVNLALLSPSNESRTTEASIVVKLTFNSEAEMKYKWRDGEWTSFTSPGEYTLTLEQSVGENVLEVSGTNLAGDVQSERYVFYRDEVEPTAAPTAVPQATATPAPEQAFRIDTVSSAAPGTFYITWSLIGYEPSDGYKIAFSKNENPEYPPRKNMGDSAQYISGGTTSQATISASGLEDGGTFHVRICRYTQKSGCDMYTQNVSVVVDKLAWGEVGLTLAKTSQESRKIGITWDVTGSGSVAKGFKVVWSTSENPTYPQATSYNESVFSKMLSALNIFEIATTQATSEGSSPVNWAYSYLSNSETRSTTVKLTDEVKYPAGTWYIRVCRYLGGSCDIYSNQISVVIE